MLVCRDSGKRVVSCSGLPGVQVKMLSRFCEQRGEAFSLNTKSTAPPECVLLQAAIRLPQSDPFVHLLDHLCLVVIFV